MPLTPLQEDAIKELFNLSMGQVIASLSQMVDAEITVALPEFHVVERHQRKQRLAGYLGEDVEMVTMPCRLQFPGQGDGVSGLVLLVMAQSAMPVLLKRLWGSLPPPAEQEDRARETIREMGDLLLYTCASNMSHLLAAEIQGDSAMVTTELPGSTTGNALLAELRVAFHLAEQGEVQGLLVFLLELARLPLLQQELDRLLQPADVVPLD